MNKMKRNEISGLKLSAFTRGLSGVIAGVFFGMAPVMAQVCNPVIQCPSDTTIECGTSSDPAVTGTPTVSTTCQDTPIYSFEDQVISCGQSGAGPRILSVQTGGQENGFSFSSVDNATGPSFTVNGTTYWIGAALFPILEDQETDMTITEQAPGVYLLQGTLELQNHQDMTIDGVLDFTVPQGALAGTLDFFAGEGGTWYVYNDTIQGSANSISNGELRILANNWPNATQTRAEFDAQGIAFKPCALRLAASYPEPPPCCGGESTILRTWTVDVGGETSSCVQIISVKDSLAPQLVSVSDQSVNGNDQCEASIPDFGVTASDACGNVVSLVQVPAAGTVVSGPADVSVVTTATDDCGNVASVTNTFSVACLSDIGDLVWEDSNRDGRYDAGVEQGVGGVRVVLLDASGTQVDEMPTRSNGSYLFADRLPGTYRVMFDPTTLPAGSSFTTKDVTPGNDDALDSDADETSGLTDSFVLVAGVDNLTVDAGLLPCDGLTLVCPPDVTIECDELANLGPATAISGCDGPVTPTFVDVEIPCTQAGNGGLANGPLNVLTGSEGPFQFSYLDNADRESFEANGVTYWVGENLFTLDAGGDTDVTLVETSPNVFRIQGTIEVNNHEDLTLDGVLDFNVAPGALAGTIDFFAGESGVWYVYNDVIRGTATAIANGELRLFANNWPNATQTRAEAFAAGVKPCTLRLAADYTVTPGGGNCCPNKSMITRTWTAMDSLGNSTSCVQKITLVDTTPPVVTLPSDFVVSNSADCSFTVPDYQVATDVCGVVVTITQDPAPGTVLQGPGAFDVVVVATDDCGNASTNSVGITISCLQNIGDLVWEDRDGNGSYDSGSEPGVPNIRVVLFDDSGNFLDDMRTGPDGKYLFTGYLPGQYQITFDPASLPTGYDFTTQLSGSPVLDSNADTTTGETGLFTLLSGIDNLTIDAGLVFCDDLTLVCPADLTIECGDATDPSATGAATANSCGTPLTPTFTDVVRPCTQGNGFANGPLTVLTGSEGEFNYSFVDNADRTSLIAGGKVYWVGDGLFPVDPGGDTALTINEISPNVFRIEGTLELTNHEDMDLNGVVDFNVAPGELTGTIDFFAGEAGIWYVYKDVIQGSANSIGGGQVRLLINNWPNATQTRTEAFVAGVKPCTLRLAATYDAGPGNCCPKKSDIVRTWSVTDNLGNSTSCVQRISIVDTLPPVISGATNQTFVLDCSEADPSMPTVTALDACDGNVPVTFTGETNANLCTVEKIYTWIAKDECGNMSGVQWRIIKSDMTPPVITCPADVAVQCMSDAPGADLAGVQSSDNCGATSVSVIATNLVGSLPCNGAIEYVYQAIDECGNSATCTQVVTVADMTDPVIVCPGPVSVECMGDVPAPDVSLVQATDNCGSATVEFVGDVPSGTQCPMVITRTYRAVDACGNDVTCTQLITVNDVTPPVVTCPRLNDVSANDDCEALIPNVVPLVNASDNCSSNLAISQSPVAGTVVGLGTHIITVTVLDECGNPASCDVTLTVGDDKPPVLVCPSVLPPIDADVNCEGMVPNITNLVSVTDNCSGSASITVTQSPVAGTTLPVGSHTITVTAVDAAGNQSVCAVTQVIVDPATASLGDYVWNDRNVNGVQDAGEPFIDNVTVNLLDANGDFLRTTVTANGGLYGFTNLASGTYIVEFIAPVDTPAASARRGSQTSDNNAVGAMALGALQFTLAERGPDVADSDAGSNGRTRPIFLGCGEMNPDIDAGLFEGGDIVITKAPDPGLIIGFETFPRSNVFVSPDTVTFSFVVTNPKDVGVRNVQVTDDKCGRYRSLVATPIITRSSSRVKTGGMNACSPAILSVAVRILPTLPV